jgi:hypothetical protein
MSYRRLAALALAVVLVAAAGTAAEPGGSHLPAGPRQISYSGTVHCMASADCLRCTEPAGPPAAASAASSPSCRPPCRSQLRGSSRGRKVPRSDRVL